MNFNVLTTMIDDQTNEYQSSMRNLLIQGIKEQLKELESLFPKRVFKYDDCMGSCAIDVEPRIFDQRSFFSLEDFTGRYGWLKKEGWYRTKTILAAELCIERIFILVKLADDLHVSTGEIATGKR